MARPSVFLLFFAAFWTAIVGFADAMVGREVVNAVRSKYFRSTEGAITSSEVKREASDDEPRFTADIRYVYTVDGRAFAGDKYRFGAFAPTSAQWAQEVVAAHPVGRPVTVYFDADDPALSVLKPGIDGSHFFMLMFLTPFSVVMLGSWWFLLPQLWHWWNGTEPPPAPSFRDAGATHVRLPYLPPLATAFATLGACAFAGIFVVMLTAGSAPGLDTMFTAWVIVLGLAAVAGINTWRMERQGVFDLVIRERSVELPAMYGRAQRRTLDRSAISGVATQKNEYEDSEKSTTYDVRFARRDGSYETVVSWHDGPSAERLAAWLRGKLGLR